MLKYIKQYAAGVDGVNVYAIFSLLVFFIFFVVLLYYVRKMDKKHVEEVKNIPLDLNEKTFGSFSANNLNQA